MMYDMKNLRNKIIKMYLNLKLRKIGKVEFRYGRLICNVDMRKVYNSSNNSKDIIIDLSSTSYKKVLSRLGYLGKITYLFNGFTMHGNVKIIANSSNIRFKDCTFSNSVDIVAADDVTFQDNINLNNNFTNNKVAILGNPKKVNFYNAKVTGKPFMVVNLFFESELVSFVNSTVDLYSSSCLNLKGKELVLITSKVKLSELNLNLENLVCEDSTIEVSEYAKVNVDNSMDIDSISSKKLSLNGNEFISIEDVIAEEKSILNLLTTLKTFSSECKKLGISDEEKVEKANQMIKKM